MGHCQFCSDVHPFATWLVTPDYGSQSPGPCSPALQGLLRGKGSLFLDKCGGNSLQAHSLNRSPAQQGHQLHILTRPASHCLLSLCPSQMVPLWAWALLFSWLTGSQAAGFVPLQATATATALRSLHPACVSGEEALPTAGERIPSCWHQRVLPRNRVIRIPCLLPIPSELFSHFS